MMNREALEVFIIESLKEFGQPTHYTDICKWVWKNYEKTLKNSGDMFYVWQYEIRWAATDLRGKGILKPVIESKKGLWELNPIGIAKMLPREVLEENLVILNKDYLDALQKIKELEKQLEN